MRQCLLLLLLAYSCMITAQTFHYPVPPDSINDRQERIAYMVSHFWDEQSISDTTNFQSPRLLLDYLYLLKQEESNRLDNHIKLFVSLACKKEQSFERILFWLDQILYDSSSPHYNEDVYLRLMTEVIASEADSVMKLIPEERIKMMSQNQVGKHANDFSYVDRKRKQHRMYDVDAPLLLLIFNNPDCSLCLNTERALNINKHLQDTMNRGVLRILAITPDASLKDWKRHNYPSNWLVGFDNGKAIYKQRLYDIQRLPCMYLLDKDKRVLLKEADYGRVCKYLSENTSLFER